MQEFEGKSEKEILVFSKKLKKMRFQTRRLTHDLEYTISRFDSR